MPGGGCGACPGSGSAAGAKGTICSPGSRLEPSRLPSLQARRGGKAGELRPRSTLRATFFPQIPPHHGAAPVQSPLHMAGQCP